MIFITAHIVLYNTTWLPVLLFYFPSNKYVHFLFCLEEWQINSLQTNPLTKKLGNTWLKSVGQQKGIKVEPAKILEEWKEQRGAQGSGLLLPSRHFLIINSREKEKEREEGTEGGRERDHIGVGERIVASLWGRSPGAHYSLTAASLTHWGPHPGRKTGTRCQDFQPAVSAFPFH